MRYICDVPPLQRIQEKSARQRPVPAAAARRVAALDAKETRDDQNLVVHVAQAQFVRHADRLGAVSRIGGQALLSTCALDGSGLPALRAAIAAGLAGEEPGASAAVIASQRQRQLLLAAAEGLSAACQALLGEAGVAVAAEETLAALSRLNAMGGSGVREEVLDEVFSRFCIGK